MNFQHLTGLFMSPPWGLALLLAVLLGLAGWRMGWLTAGGGASAAILGTLIYGLGGGRAIAPLLVFLVSGSLLSLAARQIAAMKEGGRQPRTARRAAQVWANGGVPLALALVQAWLRTRWPLYRLPAEQMLYLASIAAVNADTWATEIGRMSGSVPRSLRSGKPCSAGLSGAVSVAGTLGGVAGALAIPFSVVRLWPLNGGQLVLAAWAGFLGCWIDSIAGAAVQAQYKNPQTGMLTEEPVHDGKPNALVHGWRWMNNDMVNVLAGAGGALCAAVMMHFAPSLFIP